MTDVSMVDDIMVGDISGLIYRATHPRMVGGSVSGKFARAKFAPRKQAKNSQKSRFPENPRKPDFRLAKPPSKPRSLRSLLRNRARETGLYIN